MSNAEAELANAQKDLKTAKQVQSGGKHSVQPVIVVQHVGDTDPTGVMLNINDDPTIMSENEDYYYASTAVDDEQQASITVYYRGGAEIECDLGRIGPDDSGPFRYRIEGDRCLEAE